MARRRDNHLKQWLRRMVWFYTAKAIKETQAEDKPKPVAYYFEPTVSDFLNGAPEDGTPAYYDKDLIAGLQNVPLGKKDTDASK